MTLTLCLIPSIRIKQKLVTKAYDFLPASAYLPAFFKLEQEVFCCTFAARIKLVS